VDARAKLILLVIGTDRTWECCGDEWVGKCIHCQTKLRVSASGRLLMKSSVEHIVPRCHGGTDEAANLAIACKQCNQQKGSRHDTAGPGDPGYEKMVTFLKARMEARNRPLPGELQCLLGLAE
jgi:hypothetical protein